MANGHEKVLKIIDHQGNEHETHNKISAHTCQNGCYQEIKKQVSARMWEKENPRVLLVGLPTGAAAVENSTGLPYDPEFHF